MSYIKFTNKGAMSRKFLELIGATDKRSQMSDSSVIGNKGSGAKFAVVPSLRLGYEVAISSTDSEGNFLLYYEKEKVVLSANQTIEQIVFNYVNDRRFPSQLTLDALRDWDQPVGDDTQKIFKALREYICNAWDADKDFTTEIVEELSLASPGTTCAYMTITEEIEEILQNPTRYIKFINKEKPLYAIEHTGGIYKKSEPGVTRLFCQGVLVDCKKSSYYSSIFDYSLDNKWLLSEERVIKDFSQYISQLADMIVSITDLGLVIQLMKGLMNKEAELEGDALKKIKHVPQSTQDLYRAAWFAIFGDRAIIAIGSNQVDNDARNKGYVVVEGVPYHLQEFLKKCGIKTSKDFAPVVRKDAKKKDYELITLNAEQQSMYDEAYRIFLNYFPEARLFPVFFFKSEDWKFDDVLGHCGIDDKKYKEIWIKDASLVSVNQILHTFVHEGRHCLTKAGDYDRAFMNFADEYLVNLMLVSKLNPSKVTWSSKKVSKRGLLLPERFIGFSASATIKGKEVLINLTNQRSSEKYVLTASLHEDIVGSCARQQNVSRFNETKFGSIYTPEKILNQLPDEVLFHVIDVTTSQSEQLV